MIAGSKSPSGGVDPKWETKEVDTTSKKTPSPEVQMEDAGTPASGNTGMGGRGSASQGEMKRSGWKRERGV